MPKNLVDICTYLYIRAYISLKSMYVIYKPAEAAGMVRTCQIYFETC